MGLASIRGYIKVTKVAEIARRYFVMNAFDGALTMLGVIIGAWVAGNPDPHVIISAGIGASIAMGISGFNGAYMTEKAQRKKKLRDLEDRMLIGLDDTVHGRASRFASLSTALVDGISPALAAAVLVLPFIAASQGMMTTETAFYTSLILTAVELFGLGWYLAHISSQNVFAYGFQMVVVGVITAVVVVGLGSIV